jgi:hypothetical protein
VTQAICIICGIEKFGAWTDCPHCNFRPETVLELALAYSDSGRYRDRLREVSRFVKQQKATMETGKGSMPFDISMIKSVQHAIRNPDFRDILTLKRIAKDTLFSRQLNLHEIGPDGYRAHVLKRKRDIGASEFDAIRSIGDGNLYVIVSYDNGVRRQAAVSKDKWYGAYDLMLLVEREIGSRPKLQILYEELCRSWIEEHLALSPA